MKPLWLIHGAPGGHLAFVEDAASGFDGTFVGRTAAFCPARVFEASFLSFTVLIGGYREVYRLGRVFLNLLQFGE